MNQSESPSHTDSVNNESPVLRWLFRPVDAASLAFFRIAFGCTILWYVMAYVGGGLVEAYYTRPPYHLTYFGFTWVAPLSQIGMRAVFYVMGLAALGVALGLCYRICSIILFVSYTYSFLTEAALFQNHYYLTCLLAFLLCLIPANRSFSLDSLSRKQSGLAPAWCHGILAFQIAVPYVFGGIAKLDYDWIHAKPVGMWIANRNDLPIIGPFFTEPAFIQAISWGGIGFDLLVVPLLIWKRTRVLAFAATVLFHITNSILFSIDYFPWFMILATPILFSPDWPRRLLRLPPVALPEKVAILQDSHRTYKQFLAGFLAVYIGWQLLFPFRHFLYPGNPSWTEEGQQFAWRMMLRRKEVWIRFYATQKASGETIEFPITMFLTGRQVSAVAICPDQIVAASHFFASQLHQKGIVDVEIRAVVLVSLNGRKPQLMIKPDLDLTTVQRTWGHQSWILPLTEPLTDTHWDINSDDWPETLGINLPVTQPLPGQR